MAESILPEPVLPFIPKSTNLGLSSPNNTGSSVVSLANRPDRDCRPEKCPVILLVSVETLKFQRFFVPGHSEGTIEWPQADLDPEWRIIRYELDLDKNAFDGVLRLPGLKDGEFEIVHSKEKPKGRHLPRIKHNLTCSYCQKVVYGFCVMVLEDPEAACPRCMKMFDEFTGGAVVHRSPRRAAS